MRLRPGPAVALALLLSSPPAAPASLPRQSLIEVATTRPSDLDRVLEAGLDVIEVKGGHLRLLAFPQDEARLTAMGLAFRTLDPDPAATATARSRADMQRLGRPWRLPRLGARPVAATAPIGQGSMGGFWTNDEVRSFLDSLVADDPQNLVADRLDTIGYSYRGRPVLGLLLGKQDGGLATRPAAFYNALTHAREPQGMQSLLYFAHWLLSRYGSDPEATYLLDHRRIYLCPVVNPDGYAINESLLVANGAFGMWRKNARDNDEDGVMDIYPAGDGVDLNRNYGYQWGLDNVGSSPNPPSEIYRGAFPFSEPETGVQRALVDALQPRSGLSFHTFGDYFIFPWGYTPAGPPDSTDFFDWSLEATATNHLILGQAPRTLYRVNGEFNDWVYGETGEKPRGFTWTPEVGNGNDGFWPPPSRILPLAEELLRPCTVAAYVAGAWVRVLEVRFPAGPLCAGGNAPVVVLVRNKGVGQGTGPGLVGTVTPLGAGVSAVQATVGYPGIPPRSNGAPTGGAGFTLAADDTVTPGRKVPIQVDFTTPAGFFSRDTFEVVVGVPTVVFSDNADAGPGNWSLGTWAIENNDPDHPSPHFSDSPVVPVSNPRGFYANNANNVLLLTPPLNLSAGVHAYAEYTARWALEQDYDACIVEASLDGATWTPVAGRYTKAGSSVGGSTQLPGQPLYDCINYLWKPDRLDLSPFTGPAAGGVRLRFRVRSDVDKNFDGFRFDDLRVVVYDPLAQPLPVSVGGIDPGTLALAAPSPNPARGGATFQFRLPPGAGAARLELLDLQGRRVRLLAEGALAPGPHRLDWDGRDGGGRPVPSGVYLARLVGPAGTASVRRFAVIR